MLIKRGIEEAYILVRFRNTAELSNGKIIMKKSENPQWRGLLSLGYGDEKEDYLQLHPVEAMYLLFKDKIVIYSNEKKLDLTSITRYFIRRNSNLWEFFLIYTDLRTRGYPLRVKDSPFFHIHLFNRGDSTFENQPMGIIITASALRPVSLSDLNKAADMYRNLSMKLIIAIVDDIGDVTYYLVKETLEEATTIKLRKRK